MGKLSDTMLQSYNWDLERIDNLSNTNAGDAEAIQSEFCEWMDPTVPRVDVISVTYEKNLDNKPVIIS